MEEVEQLWSDSGNTVVRWRSVMVQVRRGALSMEGVEGIGRAAQAARAAMSGKMGALLILETTAEVPTPDVRDRQRDVLKSLMADERLHISSAVLGEGIAASMRRTVVRAIITGNPRVKVFSSVDDAVKHLAGTLGLPAAELGVVAEKVRAGSR
ncbi:MAG: hypothetical protein AB2A00_19490 [Myxococcota bacterium]